MRAPVLRSFAVFIFAMFVHTFGQAAEGPPGRESPPVQLEPGPQLALLGQSLEQETADRQRYRLHAAALNNRVADALRLIERGVPADVRDRQGTTSLMVAAAFGNGEVADILIEHGADPNARGGVNGATPLHFAAMAGHPAVVNLLLANGARIDIGDYLGDAPLHYAAFYNRGAMIELLAAAGADVNLTNHAGLTPFSLASRHGRMAAMATFSHLGAREGGLVEATNAGDLVRVGKLISEGADVNAPGLWGTPLHMAAAKGYVAIAAALLDAHADMEATGDPSDARPLHVAALVNDAPMAAFLIERGADTGARDAEGRTPLVVAAAFASDAVVELLLHRSASRPAIDFTSQ